MSEMPREEESLSPVHHFGSEQSTRSGNEYAGHRHIHHELNETEHYHISHCEESLPAVHHFDSEQSTCLGNEYAEHRHISQVLDETEHSRIAHESDEVQVITNQWDVHHQDTGSGRYSLDLLEHPQNVYPYHPVNYYNRSSSVHMSNEWNVHHQDTDSSRYPLDVLENPQNVYPNYPVNYNNHHQAATGSASNATTLTQTPSEGQDEQAEGSSWELTDDYDPLWMQKKGISPDAYADFGTKLKFDALFVQGAFKVGDCLIISANYLDQGEQKETEASFEYVGMTKRDVYSAIRSGTNLPSFRVTFRDCPHLNGTLDGCVGTNQIIEYLHGKGFSGPMLSAGKIAKGLNIYRGNTHLGTYYEFKHAYHLWVERQDEEARRLGVKWRQRRRPGSSTSWMRFDKG